MPNFSLTLKVNPRNNFCFSQTVLIGQIRSPENNQLCLEVHACYSDYIFEINFSLDWPTYHVFVKYELFYTLVVEKHRDIVLHHHWVKGAYQNEEDRRGGEEKNMVTEGSLCVPSLLRCLFPLKGGLLVTISKYEKAIEAIN